MLTQLPNLNEVWTRFGEATSPVDTAGVTVEFATALSPSPNDASRHLEKFDDHHGILSAAVGDIGPPGHATVPERVLGGNRPARQPVNARRSDPR